MSNERILPEIKQKIPKNLNKKYGDEMLTAQFSEGSEELPGVGFFEYISKAFGNVILTPADPESGLNLTSPASVGSIQENFYNKTSTDNRYLRKVGDFPETVSGLKAFTSPVTVEDATEGGHAVNLGQLNIELGNYYPASNPDGYISGVEWSEITGDQTDIDLSGFNNDSNFINFTDGDGRYLRLTGGTLTGDLNLDSSSSIFRLKSSDTNRDTEFLVFVGGSQDVNIRARGYTNTSDKRRLDFYTGSTKLWEMLTNGDFNVLDGNVSVNGTVSCGNATADTHAINRDTGDGRYLRLTETVGEIQKNHYRSNTGSGSGWVKIAETDSLPTSTQRLYSFTLNVNTHRSWVAPTQAGHIHVSIRFQLMSNHESVQINSMTAPNVPLKIIRTNDGSTHGKYEMYLYQTNRRLAYSVFNSSLSDLTFLSKGILQSEEPIGNFGNWRESDVGGRWFANGKEIARYESEGDKFVTEAKNGLIRITEDGTTGYCLAGDNRNAKADIGLNAVDLSTANLGTNNGASGTESTTMGYLTTASGVRATAMGHDTTASGDDSTAMGNGTTASGGASTAMGVITTADGLSSTAMGYYTTASGVRSTAMGGGTTASGDNSTAMGYYATADGDYSFAINLDSTAGPSVGANTFRISGASSIGGNLAWTNHSDARLKEEINSLNNNCLDKILNLNPVSFKWKKGQGDTRVNLGFLAQEVEEIIPEAVIYDEVNDIYSMQETAIIPVLVEAVKEQQGMIKELINEIKELKTNN